MAERGGENRIEGTLESCFCEGGGGMYGSG